MTATETLTLAAFLEARFAEDEALAGPPGEPREPYYEDSRNGLDNTHDGLIVDPLRVLADVAAKRRIVELHAPDVGNPRICRSCDEADDYLGRDRGEWSLTEDYPCPTLRALAAPYADHPDFREEWR